MTRRAAACLALLILGLVVAPASALAQQNPNARYELVHGCFGLRSVAANKAVATESAPFRMQATRLGQYLLYGKDRTFLAAGATDGLLGLGGSQPVVAPADAPDGNADWRVEVAGSGFRLTLPAAKKALAYKNGKLVAVDPAQAGADGVFAFDKAEGCATYPEVELNATGTPGKGTTFFGETTGTVDAHMHLMAFEFLGGSAHCGRPWHPYGVQYALVDCPDHFTGLAPLETALKGKPRHDPVGWPTFKDWPDNKSLTHEASYYKWLERAWLGGLRMYTNLLVDNGVLCELYPIKRNKCDEMETVRLEAKRMFELQDYIDAQSGGPGKGWFRIVKDPFEARRVVNEGKLAVVMGIEVSRLFDCTETNYQAECSKADIDRQLDEVYDMGVRQMELINKFDNALGGVAGDSGSTGVVTNTGNKYETGHFWDMRKCTGPEHAHDREQITANPDHNTDALIGNGLAKFLPPGSTPLYGPPPHCNSYGLTELGEHLVNRMIDKGMVVDPDHLSVRARNELLNVVEARKYSGIISSHSWSTPDSFPRIYKLGGMITPYAGDSKGFVEQWRETKPMRDRRFYFGFGYGADANGFGAQGAPRGPNAPNPVAYPFKGIDGAVTFDKQRSGERVYDINTDGVDHYGLYPDWMEDLRKQAGDEIIGDMLRGSEAYLQMWERAEGVPATRCRSPHLTFTKRGLGPALKLGMGPETVLRGATQPRSRKHRTFNWCVRGKRRKREQVSAVFTKTGRVAFVASNAKEHQAKGVGARAKAKRIRKTTRKLGKGLRVRSAGKKARFVYVMGKNRVRAVAIATKSASRTAKRTRGYLRLAGIR